ncbi:MAG: serine/threonine protein kinase [Nannocystaceae bacterium]|nr:serine/threonine protein kinase [Nannocystaceae bacterium]
MPPEPATEPQPSCPRSTVGARPDDAEPGWVACLSRYQLLGRIATGSMGVVYRAHDRRLDRIVALKLLRLDARHRAVPRDFGIARARFLLEARAMAQLAHPNVVPIYGLETVGPQVSIAMEFVPGVTLAQWLQHPRTWTEVVAVMLAAAEGLAAAHDAGVVHRDFKPHNILIGDDGRVRVTDFGLAALCPPSGAVASEAERTQTELATVDVAGDSMIESLTQTGMSVGTPAYMAPEQHTGGTVDARSDQYAFCTTLYEALFGVRPFIGPNAFELARAKRKLLLLPPLRGHDVPASVRRVVLRGLSPDPAARFATMHELRAALRPRPRRWTPRAAVGLALAGFAAGLACTLALPRARAAEAVEVVASVRSSAPVRVATELTAASQAIARGEVDRGRALLSEFYFAAVADDRLVDASRAADALSRSFARGSDAEHAEQWRRHAATARTRLRAQARDAAEDAGDVGPSP